MRSRPFFVGAKCVFYIEYIIANKKFALYLFKIRKL